MARFQRVDVIRALLDAGLLPIFYNGDPDTAAEIAAACSRGGARVVEMTNRGEDAYPVFSELVRRFAKDDPGLILGVGSVMDAPTAAMFLAAGANFIVGPSLNPEIARLCNRRKALYIPGCATETEIATAEELGAEICKIFPGDSAGGPAFVRAVMAPCPWHRLLPTGGIDSTEESIGGWIKAGAAVLGMGSKLITKDLVKAGDFDAIAAKTADCLAWIRKARGTPLFLGIEHIGLYPNKAKAKAINDWYADTFGFASREGSSSYFLSGSGAGRAEVMKTRQDTPVHIAVRVSDFEEAVAALKAKGIGIRDAKASAGFKSAYLEQNDPEGNPVHLLWLAKG
jgi:2-dehydro-3-deoxyphosphogluconate aldolase/(4S)-4-hydroxy-2-oxoglutarate aldolase